MNNFAWVHRVGRAARLGAVVLLVLARPVSALEIIGHRGASSDAPENTLAAFKLAYAQGADAVELDVYLTKDDQLIIVHDDSTLRTTGVDWKPREHTLAELRTLEAGQWGRWKGRGFTEKLPTLDEALAIVPAGKQVVIHIKVGREILSELDRAIVRSRIKWGQVILICFDFEVTKQAKAKMPKSTVLWLVGWGKDGSGHYPNAGWLVEKTVGAKIDGVDLDFHWPITADVVRNLKESRLEVFTWTVDDPSIAKQEADAGVAGITTDRPGWLREQLR